MHGGDMLRKGLFDFSHTDAPHGPHFIDLRNFRQLNTLWNHFKIWFEEFHLKRILFDTFTNTLFNWVAVSIKFLFWFFAKHIVDHALGFVSGSIFLSCRITIFSWCLTFLNWSLWIISLDFWVYCRRLL